MERKRQYHHGDLAAALLQAAEEELEDNGIERFSLRSVAKRAGVSHGASAHHFRDRRGLLTALAARGYQRLLQYQIDSQQGRNTQPRERIVASGLGYVRFATQHPALFRLLFSSEQTDREDAALQRGSLATFEKLVQETEATSGQNPFRSSEAMKDLMASWSMVHGLAELVVTGRAERALNLSSLSPTECDQVLEDIIRRMKPYAGEE